MSDLFIYQCELTIQNHQKLFKANNFIIFMPKLERVSVEKV